MGTNFMAAGELVDCVKAIVRDELNTRDQVVVGTIKARNDDDTYSVYIDSQDGTTAGSSMIRVSNESKHTYSPGDHVYVLKIRNQAAQAFIVASLGEAGGQTLSLASVERKADKANESIARLGMNHPAFAVKAVPWTTDDDPPEKRLAIQISWLGNIMFSLLKTKFELNGVSYSAEIELSLDGAHDPALFLTASSDPTFIPTQGMNVFGLISYGSKIQSLYLITTRLYDSGRWSLSNVQTYAPLGFVLMDVECVIS